MMEGKKEDSEDARGMETHGNMGNRARLNENGKKRLRELSTDEEEVVEQALGGKRRKHLRVGYLGGSLSSDSVRSKLSNLGIWSENTSVGSSNMEWSDVEAERASTPEGVSSRDSCYDDKDQLDILKLNMDNGRVRDIVADTLSGTIQVTLKSCVVSVGYESLEESKKSVASPEPTFEDEDSCIAPSVQSTDESSVDGIGYKEGGVARAVGTLMGVNAGRVAERMEGIRNESLEGESSYDWDGSEPSIYLKFKAVGDPIGRSEGEGRGVATEEEVKTVPVDGLVSKDPSLVLKGDEYNTASVKLDAREGAFTEGNPSGGAKLFDQDGEEDDEKLSQDIN